MWLVLCSRADAPALWAAARLQAFGRHVEVLATEDLDVPGVRWSHAVNRHAARTRMTLPGGREISSGRVSAVLNRMLIPPMDVVRRAVPGDATYARSELVAFTMSWVAALAPTVVNAPVSRGLSGAWRSSLEWRGMARRAGLATTALDISSDRAPEPPDAAPPATDVLVVGDEAFAPALSTRLRFGAVRLAQLAETPILGLSLAPGTERILAVTPHPDLSAAGERGARALERLLAA